MTAGASWIDRATKRIESFNGLTKAVLGLVTSAGMLLAAVAVLGSDKSTDREIEPTADGTVVDKPANDPGAIPPLEPLKTDKVPTEVAAAYLAAMSAYNQADAETYQRAYTDPIDCYYGEAASAASPPIAPTRR